MRGEGPRPESFGVPSVRWTGRLGLGCDYVRMGLLAGGELVVVETEDDLFLGTAEVLADVIVVRSGFVGRPVVLAHEDVVRVTPFAEFSDPAE
jgi:hypothetical protein